mgnify:CR=1 FL=1
MGALEVGSLHGARFLGMDGDIGSIAVGKLADLIVLAGESADLSARPEELAPLLGV